MKKKKFVIIYSSNFPLDVPPRYYLHLAQELSKRVPVIVIDGFHYINDKKLEFLRKIAAVKNVFIPGSFFIFGTYSKIFRLSLKTKLIVYRLLGYKVVLIKNYLGSINNEQILNADITLFDCTDHYFDTEFENAKSELSLFNAILANYDYMVMLLKKFNKRVVKTATGYIRTMKAKKQKKIDKSVVFSGGISRRINFKVLEQVVKKLPSYRFYFLGEVYLNTYYMYFGNDDSADYYQWKKILSYKNVTYLGNTTVEAAFSLLNKFEIGIIPYETKTCMNLHSNPMKLYEYLLHDMPVISTPIISVIENQKKYPIFLAESADDFVSKIKLAHTNKKNIVDKQTLLIENHIACKAAQIIKLINSLY